ncbi:hypothetical protein B0H17DRAFT_427204 [Mycena rosella]|uniref:Uncharacterized protein n=1 Tax=Mycena rosella TaxID=1033263 RepID=A0AAD7DP42_MYCRO|nr:hypothetical protein B0H17DRAFT_427204 [Mycena rosella]
MRISLRLICFPRRQRWNNGWRKWKADRASWSIRLRVLSNDRECAFILLTRDTTRRSATWPLVLMGSTYIPPEAAAANDESGLNDCDTSTGYTASAKSHYLVDSTQSQMCTVRNSRNRLSIRTKHPSENTLRISARPCVNGNLIPAQPRPTPRSSTPNALLSERRTQERAVLAVAFNATSTASKILGSFFPLCDGISSSNMPATIDVPSTISAPTFPEDIERAIIDALLNDARDMRGTMSLVDSRFYAWTKPARFHTVVIRHTHTDWQTRIRDLFLPNARFIRVMAISLPTRRQGWYPAASTERPAQLSDEDLSHIRRLLQASDSVRHFAVDWNIWPCLLRECGALQLESLYLIWDGVLPTHIPSLRSLRNPATLKDLTIYAPRSTSPDHFRPPDFSLPAVAHCANLAYVTYVTYAANLTLTLPLTRMRTDLAHLKGIMFVFGGETPTEERDDILNTKKLYPNFSTVYLGSTLSVLGEWLAKMEGRQSVLEHPPPRAVE